MSSQNFRFVFGKKWVGALAGVSLLALAGCEDSQSFGFLKPSEEDAAPAVSSAATQLIERDVEAPEVFEVREPGLWDGRPSLGGVWAAHPDVEEPERIILRNEENGKFVIGALFRKERDTPGPKLQISSDAAEELGILAGQPTNVYAVALRRETVTEDPSTEEIVAEADPVFDAPAAGFDAPAAVATGTLETSSDAVSVAAAALDEPAPVVQASLETAPAPTPKPAPSTALKKPYLQIGIFSIEQNAQNTAQVMRGAGIVPTVLEQSSNGKTFWRVVVGPAQTKSEQRVLLETIRGKGFEDAYAVTN